MTTTTTPYCCAELGYTKLNTDGVARCGTCWDDLAQSLVESIVRANDALRRSNAAESDPTGPAGVYGFGRCDRCGESFREDDEQAEVAGTKDSPASLLLDNIVIHVGCISDSDTLA